MRQPNSRSHNTGRPKARLERNTGWIMAIEPIGKTIGTIFRGLSSPGQDNKQRVYDTFLALLDEKERMHIEPWSLEEKVLTLCVDSPAWLYAFNLKKPRILKALQDKAGSSIIEQIRLKIGRPHRASGREV